VKVFKIILKIILVIVMLGMYFVAGTLGYKKGYWGGIDASATHVYRSCSRGNVLIVYGKEFRCSPVREL